LFQGEEVKAHEIVYKAIPGDMVKRAAMETKVSAGPSGMDANSWRRLLKSRRNAEVVADLRTAIAKLARKLCTEKCEHVEPITASHLIPAKRKTQMESGPLELVRE